MPREIGCEEKRERTRSFQLEVDLKQMNSTGASKWRTIQSGKRRVSLGWMREDEIWLSLDIL